MMAAMENPCAVRNPDRPGRRSAGAFPCRGGSRGFETRMTRRPAPEPGRSAETVCRAALNVANPAPTGAPCALRPQISAMATQAFAQGRRHGALVLPSQGVSRPAPASVRLTKPARHCAFIDVLWVGRLAAPPTWSATPDCAICPIGGRARWRRAIREPALPGGTTR